MAFEPMTTPELRPLNEQELDDLTLKARSHQFTDNSPDLAVPLMPSVLLRLIAQARAARPSPWQDISTAPKDRAILVAFKLGREWAIGAAHWQEFWDGSRGWIGSSFWSESGQSWGTVTDPIRSTGRNIPRLSTLVSAGPLPTVRTLHAVYSAE